MACVYVSDILQYLVQVGNLPCQSWHYPQSKTKLRNTYLCKQHM